MISYDLYKIRLNNEHEMKESLPKSWDKTKRVYEISYPNGKKEIWKNMTARECLTSMKIWIHLEMD